MNIAQALIRSLMLLNLLEMPGTGVLGPYSICILGILQNLIGISRQYSMINSEQSKARLQRTDSLFPSQSDGLNLQNNMMVERHFDS